MVGNISLGEITGTGTEITKLMPFELERKTFFKATAYKSRWKKTGA